VLVKFELTDEIKKLVAVLISGRIAIRCQLRSTPHHIVGLVPTSVAFRRRSDAR
jgi:hypothetical protein